jgi:hypothetical protein
MSWSSNRRNRIPYIGSFEQAQALFNRAPFYEKSPYWAAMPHVRSLHDVDDKSLTITEYYDRSGKATRYEVHIWIYSGATRDGSNATIVFYAPNKRGEAVVRMPAKAYWSALAELGWPDGKRLDATDGTQRHFFSTKEGTTLTFVNGKLDVRRSTNGRHYSRYTGPDVRAKRKAVREWAWPLCTMTAMVAMSGENGLEGYQRHFPGMLRAQLTALHNGEELTDADRATMLRHMTRMAWDSRETMRTWNRELRQYESRVRTLDEIVEELIRRVRDTVEPVQGQRRLGPLWPTKLPPEWWLTDECPDRFDDVEEA